jgi:hypothetical protein
VKGTILTAVMALHFYSRDDQPFQGNEPLTENRNRAQSRGGTIQKRRLVLS